MEQKTSHNEAKKEGWLNLRVSVSIWEMLATVLLTLMLMSGAFFVRFGTLDPNSIKFNTGLDTGGYETVDYTKYQTVYFVSPGEKGKIFATRINDPGTIYTVGYIDKRITRYEMTMEYRLRELEKEIMLLREDIKKFTGVKNPE